MIRSRFVLLLLIAGLPAHADGPHIALHRTSGATTVSVFTAPDPLTPGPAEVSILVQNAADSAAADAPVDAQVDALLLGDGAPRHLQLRRTDTLLAAHLFFSRPGAYRLSLRIARAGTPPSEFTVPFDVQPDTGRRTTVVVAVAVPLAIVALFLVNQHLKARHRRPSGKAG